MKIQKTADVWLVKKRNTRPIDVVQYDTGVQLVFTVQDLQLPSGTTGTLYVQKPSGKFVYQETGITITQNAITIDLLNQALTEYGSIPYQVQLENGSDLITTFAGIFRVEKSLANDGAVESQSVPSMLADKIIRGKGSAIVCDKQGYVISVADASNDYIRGLTIYGKTTQNGTPTPDAPVPLETVGADGNVAVTVYGKNLFALKDYKTTSDFITRETKNGVLKVVVVSEGGNLLTVLVSAFINASFVGTNNFPAGTYTYNGAARVVRSGISNTENTRVHLILADGTSTTIDHGTTKAIAQGFSVEKITFMSGTLDLRLNDTVTLLPILESGNSAIQTLTIQTPNGLPGIPVSSGGNYTDENGQKWICDEIDFARGKYIKRVGRLNMSNYKDLNVGVNAAGLHYIDVRKNSNDGNTSYHILCNCYKSYVPNSNVVTDKMVRQWTNSVTVYDSDFTDLETAKAKLESLGFECLYPIQREMQVESDLTAEEIAQYSALHTNKPNTTVYNDSGAGIGLAYNADTKLYIDNKFNELALAILNNA